MAQEYKRNSAAPISGPKAPAGATAASGPTPDRAVTAENRVRINGMQQVLDMLQVADPAFRESLLKRIGERDRELARNLRARLGQR